MFWKIFWRILFVLLCLLVGFLSIGGMSSSIEISEMNFAIGYMFEVVIMFICGYFFALGWEKRLYSSKANNLIFVSTMLFVILTIGLAVWYALPELRLGLSASAAPGAFAFGAGVLVVFATILYFLLYSPAIAAYFVYRHKLPVLSDVKKPYWKLMLTFFIVQHIISTISFTILIIMQNLQVNVWDWLALVTVIIDALYIIGYAYNIKFGKQIFWKIITIPYIAFSIGTYFLASDDFMQLTGNYLLKESYVMLILGVILFMMYTYALYRYAFSKDVYSNSDDLLPEKLDDTL